MIGYTDWSENGWKAVHDIQRKKLLKLFLKFTLKYFKKIWLTLGNKIQRNIKKRGSKAFAHHCMQWSLCHLSCTFVYKKYNQHSLLESTSAKCIFFLLSTLLKVVVIAVVERRYFYFEIKNTWTWLVPFDVTSGQEIATQATGIITLHLKSLY